MGFKRTSEGRVFFQGSDASANDHPEERTSHQPKSKQAGDSPLDPEDLGAKPTGQITQLQILTLLKSLNDKLKTTQTERNRMQKELEKYRDVIEALEEKSDKNEKAYLQLARKVAQPGAVSANGEGNASGRVEQAEKIARETLKELQDTRKLLLHLEEKTERADKGVEALKTLQQEQAQKMSKGASGYVQLAKRLQETEVRQEDLTGRIEETISQQARLVRKIDKSIEDRARFMRKIERIEETVLQTRDSLNAKAMVLLTDQGAAAKVALQDPDDIESGEPLLLDDQLAAGVAQADPHVRGRQIGWAAAFGVVCILAGWFVSEMQKPDIPDLNAIDQQIMSEVGIERAPAPRDYTSQVAGQNSETAQDWGVREDTSAFAEQTEAQQQPQQQEPYRAPPVDVGAADDIGTLELQSDEELLNLLDGNPGQVASTLNEIEPGSNQRIVQAEPPAPAQPEITAPTPSNFKVEAPRGNGVPGSVNPDSSLPDVIKSIEEQAFKGVAEAQHDLAAVYTAGHAGVRQDYSRASYWFKQAADQGIANAAYNLGVLNHQGLGMKTDLDEAIRWYAKAAELGHAEAQYNLGIAFIEGIGVPYDPVRAADYFESAANAGITEAAYNLGLIYENGLLGQPQPDEALVWYKTAADAGSPEAKAALEQLAKALGMKIEDINKLAESMKGASAEGAQSNQAPPSQSYARAAPPEMPAPLTEEEQAPLVASVSDPAPAVEYTYSAQEQEAVLTAQVQEYLMRLGLYPGPADGVSGPLTSDAIRSYQSLNKLDVDGTASDALLSHMLANAGSFEPQEFGSRE